MIKLALIFFFCITTLASQIHEVIIIGAGASGIAASLVLSKHNVSHLML